MRVRGSRLHDNVLNSTAVILDVAPDPALVSRLLLECPKVYWKHVRRGDKDALRLTTGYVSAAVKGMLSSRGLTEVGITSDNGIGEAILDKSSQIEVLSWQTI